MYFHSDGSENDWGFKITARAHVKKAITAPLVPPKPALITARLLKWQALAATDMLLQEGPASFTEEILPLVPLLVDVSSTVADPGGAAEPPKPLEFESNHPYDNSDDK